MAPLRRTRFRQIVTLLLAILGIQGWLLILHGDWGRNSHVTLLMAAIVVGCIPPLHRPIWWALRRLRRPTGVGRGIIALGVAVVAAAALWRFAVNSHRDLFPVMHDEFQFLLQARMLASGRLWMPGHPLVDFFDTFYVLIQPKYAAQSFPGTAFFYVPAIWLHVAPWKWTIGLAGISVGLVYLVATELVDGLAGLLAAGLYGLLSLVRFVSTMALAQTPAVLLGLLMILVYLAWRRRRGVAIALLLGFVGGMAAITRPADAAIVGLPVAVAICLDLRRRHAGAAKGIAAMLAGAAPWLALQLIFNVGVTGHWLTTPFAYYNQRDQPGLRYGLTGGTPGRPMTHVREKREYYERVVEPAMRAQRPDLLWHTFAVERLPDTVSETLPQGILAALIPLGWLACGRRRAWIGVAGLPLFLVVYTPYPIYTLHYAAIAVPAMILTVVLAPKAIALAWPKARAGAWTAAAIFVAGLLLTRPVVGIFPLVNALAHPEVLLKAANDDLAALAAKGQAAVVLFRRDPKLPLDTEPVYNIETAWPDDAVVIRAHDRGRQNWQIYRYYAEHGPDRAFYRFDESRVAGGLTFIGMASDLSKRSGGH